MIRLSCLKRAAVDHVDSLLSSGDSLLYALRVLGSNDTRPATLQDVFRATIIARMTYCATAGLGRALQQTGRDSTRS